MAENPFMSAYLSAANRVAKTARGKADQRSANRNGSGSAGGTSLGCRSGRGGWRMGAGVVPGSTRCVFGIGCGLRLVGPAFGRFHGQQ